MLKNKTKIIAFLLILFLLFSTTFVFAVEEASEDYGTEAISEDYGTEAISENSETEAISEDSESEEESEEELEEESYKQSDVYLVGENITIDYLIDGNLFVCANTVTINSQIGGDAFILAKNLIINEEGYIYSNLFTIAESIENKGFIYEVFALSENFTISNGYVYRDLKVACDTLTVNGIVGRNAYVTCANLNFNTDETNTSIIYGDLNYTSESEIAIPGDTVSGNVNYTAPYVAPNEPISSVIADYILDLGKFVVFIIIIWLICLVLAPKFLSSTNQYVGKKTLGIFGYGLLALIVIPIACFILILLQLTSGFSLLLLALYILAIIVSKSLFTITANNYVCSKLKINKNLGTFGILIVTSIVIWAITQIPYVGALISLIASVLGLGILVASILSKKDNEKKEVAEVEKTEK